MNSNSHPIKERTRLSFENWDMHGACLAERLAPLRNSADLDLLGLRVVEEAPTLLLAPPTRIHRLPTRVLHEMHDMQS